MAKLLLGSSKRIFLAGGWNSSYLLPEPVLGRKKFFCLSLATSLYYLFKAFILPIKTPMRVVTCILAIFHGKKVVRIPPPQNSPSFLHINSQA